MKRLNRWRSYSLTTGITFGAVAAGLLGVSISARVGYLAWQQAQNSLDAWQAQRASTQERGRRLLPLLASSRAQPPLEMTFVAFSPLAFQQGNARLVSWSPAVNGGEMVLDSPWQQVPSVFALLAQSDMQVTGFSLSGDRGTLRFMLQLVRNDAP